MLKSLLSWFRNSTSRNRHADSASDRRVLLGAGGRGGGYFDAVVAAIEAGRSSDPQGSEVAANEGWQAVRARDWDTAHQRFLNAVRASSHNLNAITGAGQVLASVHSMYQHAIYLFDLVLADPREDASINALRAGAWEAKSRSLWDAGERPQAVAAIDCAIELEPDYPGFRGQRQWYLDRMSGSEAASESLPSLEVPEVEGKRIVVLPADDPNAADEAGIDEETASALTDLAAGASCIVCGRNPCGDRPTVIMVQDPSSDSESAFIGGICSDCSGERLQESLRSSKLKAWLQTR